MKTDILVVGPLHQPTADRLDREFNTHKLWLAPNRNAFLKERADKIRGIATSIQWPVDAQLMDSLPKLEIISSFGVGYDSIDVAAARQRKLIVTNTPDVLNDCVADLALGLLIDASRDISRGDRYVRAGKWLQGPAPLARSVTGKRLGILGLGRIGTAIAKRAAGFDMQIAYHSRRKVADAPYRYFDKLVDLARESDYLVVITPGGTETFHLVDEAVLKALGPKGILINVARGSVVDEQALVRCLQNGSLGGAALDVFEDEPKVPEALFALDNVVVVPHIASATHETRQAMGDLTVDNLVAHFSGKPPLTPVA